MKQPKYKNEYRGAIADNAKNIKNIEYVELLYKLSEEFLNEENVKKRPESILQIEFSARSGIWAYDR